MSWFSKAFSSTIGRKLLVAVTGLFLCSFLVVHLIGNLQLFSADEGVAFNAYTYFMTHNPVIRAMEIVLLLGFVLHIWQSVYLNRRNHNARSVKYVVNHAEQNSSWSSRNMGLLGTIIFIFLLVHLYNFYFKLKFGEIGSDAAGNKNLYGIAVESFSHWWYVALYVISMVALAFHLIHGFRSAFQTLGLNHKKYTPAIRIFGYVFSVVVCAGFAAMPLYFYFLIH